MSFYEIAFFSAIALFLIIAYIGRAISIILLPKAIKERIDFIKNNKLKRMDGENYILEENCSICGNEMMITEDDTKKVYKRCTNFPDCDNNEFLQDKKRLSRGISFE